MQAKSINPYTLFSTKYKDALDTIGGNLPANPTFDQLNEVFLTAVYTSQPAIPSADTVAQLYLLPLLANLYNGYVNGIFSPLLRRGAGGEDKTVSNNTQYNENQLVIISELLQGIRQVSPEKMEDLIELQEEKTAQSKLSFEEQAPLFAACQLGKSTLQYWAAQINTPGIWASYLDPEKVLNFLHLPFLASASIQGALLGYNYMKRPAISILDICTSYAGAVGLTAGAVALGWEQL